MHVSRSLAFVMALWAAPVAAQEAMRLDLNAQVPAPQAAQTPATPAPSGPVAEAAPQEATRPAMRPATNPAPDASIDVAQNQGATGGADDKDHIIACSIIYQRIADMYRERGEGEKADTFLSTAYAYSQASDILYTQELGAENAYDAISQRMAAVSESLNREAQGYSNGDLGVVNAWLGWCDERGDFVQSTMDAFAAQTTAEANLPQGATQ